MQEMALNVDKKIWKRPFVSSWQEGQTNVINIPQNPIRLGQGQHPSSAAVCVTHWQRPWKEKKTSENSEFLQGPGDWTDFAAQKNIFTHVVWFIYFLLRWQLTCRCSQPQWHQCKDWSTICWIDFAVLSYFPCIEMTFLGFRGRFKPMIHGWMNKPEVLKVIRSQKQTVFILEGHMSRGSAALCSSQRCCGWKLVCLWWILLWASEETFFVVVVIWVPPNSKIL